MFPVLRISAFALKERPVLFKGKDSRYNPVQKIPVMRNRDNDPREPVKVVFQHLQGRDIQIICRLVQHEHIRRFHQNTQQIQPSLLSARKLADPRVLHLWRKQKTLTHSRSRHQSVFRPDILCGIANVVNDTLVFIQRFIFLTEVSDADRLSDLHAAGRRRKNAEKCFEECCFAAAVRADNTDAVCFGEHISEIVKQNATVITTGNGMRLNRLSADTGRQGIDRGLPVLHDFVTVPQRLEALDVGLLLCRAGSRSALHPCEILLVKRRHLALRRERVVKTLLPQFQITGIARVVAVRAALVDFENLSGHLVQKIAVVRDHQKRALVVLQKILQPEDHVLVEVVGRLVENQKVRRRQNSRHQSRPLLLSAGKLRGVQGRIGDTEALQHDSDFAFGVPVGFFAGYARGDVFQNCQIIIENRVLRKAGDLQPVRQNNPPLIRLQLPCCQL